MSENHPDDILTYLFTDLENSTRLWEQYPEAMRLGLEQHDALLNITVDTHRGRVVKSTGDGIYAVFESPADGVAAALAGQQALTAGNWPEETGQLKVRMGLHTGASQERAGDYLGPEVNLASRVMDLAHGGQILLTEATVALVRRGLPKDSTLADMGEHRLKGIAIKEKIFQLCHPDLIPEFPPLKSLETYKHNLHRQLSSFIGRERELAQVKNSLETTQLLTLLGPGGTGKTRLMLQVAEEVIEDYAHGVWLVELASLTNPDRIPERVAAALNVQEMPGRQMIDTLTEYLRRKELLLLLDNVEHIVRESAEFTEQLVGHCPHLKILVTGREALFISGEITLQIPSLSLPKTEQTLVEITSSEGVQLFLERARAVRPDFKLTRENASTIAEVVRRLDGIPLALELAAARLRMLTIEQINERLNDRFRLLTGGSRTALPRQQTLQALIDWSWKLLDEKEQILLRRLSVFSGSWNLEAAQAVAAFDPLDELDVFDHLEQLINKSLVTVQYPSNGEARYGMLESIHQYAQEKLFDVGEGEILRDRHVDYFVTFSHEAEQHLRMSTMLPWVERIVQELDNIRSVLVWAQKDRPELALRIGAALFYNLAHWIHPSEVISWLEASIERTRKLLKQENSPLRIQDFIKALYALGFVKSFLGEVKVSIELVEEGIHLAQQAGELRLYAQGIAQKFGSISAFWMETTEDWLQLVEDTIEMCLEKGFEWELSRLHLNMGAYLMQQGKVEQSRQHFHESEIIIKKQQNPRELATLYAVKAEVAMAQGDLETGRQIYEQAAEAFTAINDQRIELIVKSNLSHLLRRSGKIVEAIPYYRDTILKWQELGNPVALAHQLECFAFIGINEGLYEHAALLLGTAKETRERLDAVSSDPREVIELEEAMSQLVEVLGKSECERLMAEGAGLDLDEAVQLALQRLS